MFSYFIKRLLMIIPTLVSVTILVFLLLTLTPGDPAEIAIGSGATEVQLEQFRELHDLNASIPVRYIKYMAGAVRGDFGMSYMTRLSVGYMISIRVGNTLLLSFSSMILAVVVSLFLGIVMALKQNSLFDNGMRVITIVFTSMPQFWLALMMILLFTVALGWLPSTGLTSFKHAIMPVTCLALREITTCARTGRAAMLEVISKDYVRTARAKGLKRGYVIRKHALKNSLLPMVTIYGRMVGHCFAGSIVIEAIFGINGIGTMLTTALRQKDIPVIMGGIIISASIIAVTNLLTDLAYTFIDPRIKSRFTRRKRTRKLEISNG